ncbi:hypothetical protein GCM10017781_32660 [Deinococcus metalli]|uniref:Uncharacterized protein n=2 Tax=Deinococcus metalli TaxID=1141878 RepID=A0ABQ3JU52_9DEIO|nr:hypothetical protein GCM10017781_32660 [Deinococcus metalli]
MGTRFQAADPALRMARVPSRRCGFALAGGPALTASRYNFTRPGCGHHPAVSGGEAVGMVAVVSTISGQDGHTLCAVEVGKHGKVTSEPRCPRGKTRRWPLWMAGDS